MFNFYRYIAYALIVFTLTACGSAQPAEAATKAQSIQFLLSQVRASGVALSGGKVDFYEAGGTTTRKTVWLDRNKATAAANPYTLDSNGTAQLYGDGLYRIVIKDSAGVTKYDRDYISIKEVAGNVYDVADYASLAAAVASIGSTPATLQFAADVTVSANLVIPSTLELMPLNGAKINHTTYTISYAGSTARWPLAQIFDGTGAVTGLKEAHPEWWGAKADGVTASGPAFRKAVSSGVRKLNLAAGTYVIDAVSSSGTVYMLPDTVTTKFGFVTSSNIIIQGSSFYHSYTSAWDATHTRTKLKITGGDATTVGVYLNNVNVTLSSLEIEMDGLPVGGWAVKGNGAFNTIEKCALRADKGVHFTYVLNTNLRFCSIYAPHAAVRIDSGTSFDLYNNYFSGDSLADTVAVTIGDPSLSSPVGDSTILSGVSHSNIIEGFAYGHYLDPAHGVLSGSFSAPSFLAQRIILRGNYYENIATNYLWAKDANFASYDDITNSPASLGFSYNVTWDKVTTPYRYSKIEHGSGDNRVPAVAIGPTSGTRDSDLAYGELKITPDRYATPRVRLINNGQAGDGRKAEVILGDSSTGYQWRVRYDRDDAAALTFRLFDGSTEAVVMRLSNTIPTYADNAAATAASLPVGTVYRTSAGQMMIRY